MKDILADRFEPDISAEDVPGGGASLRPAPWRRPEVVTEPMLADARAEMRLHDAAMQRAGPESIRRWLLTLGSVTARQPGEIADMETRLDGLCLVLEDEPGAAFTKGSLKRAAARFAFFPGSAELIDFIATETAALRQRGARLMMILDSVNRPAAKRSPQDREWTWSKDEAERHSQRLYEEKARERAEMMGACGWTQFPVPPQASDESEPDYVHRLVRFCGEVNRTAEADMARRARDRRKMGRYPERAPEPPPPVSDVPSGSAATKPDNPVETTTEEPTP